jgi:hypothetical protein
MAHTAYISNVKAWPIKEEGVGIRAVLAGKFDSAPQGFGAMAWHAIMGGKTVEIRYIVELRKEISIMPDEVVASCVFTYTLWSPGIVGATYGENYATISVSSSQTGQLQNIKVYSAEESENILRNFGIMANTDHFVLCYGWQDEDDNKTFNVRIRAEASIPYQFDERTVWKKSSSFSIPAEYCRTTYEGRNLGEEIIGTLGFDNLPRTPQCCHLNNYTVRINEVIRIAFETYDPDDEDQCYVTVSWGDNSEDRGSWLDKRPQWQSTYFAHTYRYPGVYTIKAFATSERNAKSGWSDPIIVRVER